MEQSAGPALYGIAERKAHIETYLSYSDAPVYGACRAIVQQVGCGLAKTGFTQVLHIFQGKRPLGRLNAYGSALRVFQAVQKHGNQYLKDRSDSLTS
jgi:hypothetical protein